MYCSTIARGAKPTVIRPRLELNDIGVSRQARPFDNAFERLVGEVQEERYPLDTYTVCGMRIQMVQPALTHVEARTWTPCLVTRTHPTAGELERTGSCRSSLVE